MISKWDEALAKLARNVELVNADYILRIMRERLLPVLEAAEHLRDADTVAGGMTGPGNTPEQCQGYSDACRDIRKALHGKVEALRTALDKLIHG